MGYSEGFAVGLSEGCNSIREAENNLLDDQIISKAKMKEDISNAPLQLASELGSL